MRHYEHLQWGSDRLRLAPWRGDPTIAELAPARAGQSPTPTSIIRGLELVAGRGYRAVVTNALAPEEQHGYLRAGFSVHERLHLLSRTLELVPEPTAGHRLRRARRRDRPIVLDVDGAAFDPFWRLDQPSLDEAIAATPYTRVRVTAGSEVVGYAVTGRAGPRGFLQRLAVHPDHQGQGWGTALVVDALRWLRRRGAATVMVNTQEANATALALYCELGFTPQPDGLAVLAYQFASPS